MPEIQPARHASFQDEIDHSQNKGASDTSASTPKLTFGYATVRSSGAPSTIDQRAAAGKGGASLATILRKSRDAKAMHSPAPMSPNRPILAWAAALASLCLTGCGRGPVEPIGVPLTNTITIQMYVQGQITPSQGDYIFAINADLDPVTNVNANFNETPNEPTMLEAYGSNPAPFTHWDQAFVYGNNPHGLPFCPLAGPPPTGYVYCYKAIRVNGGQNSISFVQIFVSANDIRLVPNGNGNGGTQNTLSLTLPISCLSLRPSNAGSNCDTVNPVDVTQIYVNLLTIDNANPFVPQDQIACLAAQTFIIDLTTSSTTPLLKSGSCPNPPDNNPNLTITGGTVIINKPGG